ncbi:MAG: hypothetical protein LAT56_00770 [Wenzhouxiangella sp.]|nr:hypothetical protein [Wenzhouxiangella sp.]
MIDFSYGPCCPPSDPGTPEGFPGASVLFCYQLVNQGQVDLTGVRVIDPGFGLMADLDIQLAPGAEMVFADANGRRPLSEPLRGFPGFFVTDGNRQGFRRTAHQVAFSPHLTFYRLMAASEDDCQPGLYGPFPPPPTSGYRLRTVTPGASVVHCLSMYNASTTGGTVGFPSLREHDISDSLLGVLADSENIELSAFPHRFWTLRHIASAPAIDAEYSTSWSTQADWLHQDEPASIALDVVDTAALRVVNNPACEGIVEHTSSAYDALLGIAVASGIRLDFQVEAEPALSGQSSQITAIGFISNLQPEQAFGPRDDTRILLPLPEGIDLASLSISGSISGGVPLQVSIDAEQRMARLSTGPVPGIPATVFLSILVTPDGSAPTLIWPAPSLNMVILDSGGAEITRVLQPETGAPPVLTQPLCSP